MSTHRILYLTPDDPTPCGGVRVIYNHVDALHRHGFDAAVVHRQPGFRCTWFANQTPVRYAATIPPQPSDVFVFTEINADRVLATPRGFHKVIFNQAFFLTFQSDRFDPAQTATPYRHPDLAAVLVNSRAGAEFLSYVFPQTPLHRIRCAIDPAECYFQQAKKPQIAFMPRRNGDQAQQVLSILKYRGLLRDVGVAPIVDLPYKQAMARLRESLYFLSLGTQEGLGAPPAEAMACGCITAGYHGFGGREFLTPEFAFPVEPLDVLTCARTLEQVIRQYQADPAPLDALRRRASDFVTSYYAPQEEEREVVAAWTEILKKL